MSRLPERTDTPAGVADDACQGRRSAASRRALGFIVWNSLLVAAVSSAPAGESAGPGRARAADRNTSGAASSKSARQLYSAGRELYWQERYAEAAAAFESAAAAPGDLSADDRRRLDDYLNRARVKSGVTAAPKEVIARAQSDDQPPSAASPAASLQQKQSAARKILAEARRKFNDGKIAEAERLAQSCKRQGVQWRIFGDNPEKLLEEIKEYRRQNPAPVIQADGVRTPGSSRRDIQQPEADEDESLDLDLPEEVSSEPPAAPVAERSRRESSPATGSRGDDSVRNRAQELLKQAESLLEAGRVEEARAKVRQAEKLDVAFEGAMALTPEYLLAMIERAERDGMLAQNAGTGKSSRLAAGSPAPRSSRETGSRETASSAKVTRKQEALQLTEEADADLEAGRLEEAQSKAGQARDMDLAYDLLDKTPEDVLDKAEVAIDKRYLAGKRPAPRSAEGAEEADAALEEITQARGPAEHETETEDPAVVHPNRMSALDLYNRGRVAIRSGNPELALQCYLQAYQSGERLDSRREQEIREYLAQHRGKMKKIQLLGTRQVPGSEGGSEVAGDGENESGPSGQEDLPRRIDQVDEQRQITLDKLRTEVRNAEFRAEKLATTDPQAALELIDKAQGSVERSELEPAITRQLLKSLARSRDNIEYNRKINSPRIEMARHKKEVESTIKREEQEKLRIDQDFAEKVEKYNDLMKQKRFDEAIVLAKEARLMQPESPTSELMVLKARFARQEDFNRNNRERKADMFTQQLNDVDEAATGYVADIVYPDAEKWQKLTELRRKYKRADSSVPNVEEQKIERSLSREVSLHFDNAPLAEVIKRLASLADVNIVLDPSGLEDEGVTSNTNVSINIDAIRLKSALNLLLEPLRLGYTVKDDVLKITSHMKQQGELVTKNYSVADLVVPIRDFGPVPGNQGMQPSGFNTGNQALPRGAGLGQMNVTSTGGSQKRAGQTFAQVDDRERRSPAGNSQPGTSENPGMYGGGVQADFRSLMNLITTTVQPDSWEELSGPGSVMPYRTTLSLVIRQTQAVHEEIADLLGQLRRLQDLQVTVECRFVTVSDNFFERIGINFNFNLPTNVSNGLQNTFGQPLPPFGIGQSFPTSTTGTTGTSGTSTQGTTGTTGTSGTSGTSGGATGGGGGGPFTPGPPIDTTNYNHWPRYGVIAGIDQSNAFTSDLNIPFRQGSFSIGVPKFGGFDANAGLSVGFAILSDIETFFLINAAQGDTRNNLLFAPKITLFNGQIATVTDTVQRPFVTSLIPTVGFFSVGFQPQITVLPEGVTMTVQAVIRADRRYVRLTVVPSFTAITNVQSFSFISGSGTNPTAGGTTGGAQSGGAQSGASGLSGFGGGFGAGGIGGGLIGITGSSGQSGTSQAGQNGQTGTGVDAGSQITIQQPIFEIISVATTVSVPDGGTVLLGGIKRLREGRTMAGVPILNKLPYISRLFKNTGVGRETESLMLMVTPRIIIQEEEEELLGVDLPQR